MFGFWRKGQRPPARAPKAREMAAAKSRAEDRLPERPSLDGYVVQEIPDGVADLLVAAFRRR